VKGGASAPNSSMNRLCRTTKRAGARASLPSPAALFAMLALSACSFEDTRVHCSSSQKCPTGETCDRGFCVSNRLETDRNPSTAPDPNKDSGTTPRDAAASEPMGMTGMTDPPPAASNDAGPSDAGSKPANPNACEAGSTRSCMLSGKSAQRCRIGIQQCENGAYGACMATETPQPETCDGVDEDCDGKVDENVVVDCYPDKTAGCTVGKNTPSMCQGRCALGKQTCVNGKLSACSGAITPQAEACTTSGLSVDEDCNGRSDEICACNQGETRACYPAASDTLNVGKCRAGSQACANGMLGACEGAVMPQTETCANEGADDNCDGTADNVLNRNAPCSVASNMGACRAGTLQCKGAELACVTLVPAAESCNGFDDDCNGKVDEPFDLQTDHANCGACGTVCATSETCCAGKCVNLQEDENNCGACGSTNVCTSGSTCCGGMCVNTMQNDTSCGACGIACAMGKTCCGGQCVDMKNDPKHCGTCATECSMGAQPGCCDGACVDFLSQQNCGRCGQSCGVLDGGIVCTCSTTQNGTMCMSPVLGVCL
jgi:hypothetical protein